MGKGSKRRPGKGYEDNYEKIFGNKKAVTSRKSFGGNGGTKMVGIIPDIEPFVSPITGEVITSRSHLRVHQKEHGVTDSRDYSPEFMEKKQIERTERMCGLTKKDTHDRIQALRESIHKHTGR